MPSEPPIIEARNLSKRYRRTHEPTVESMGMHHLLGDIAALPWHLARRAFSSRPRHDASVADDSFWALKDISFDLHRGETLGVIGSNGAGKSVLFKILAQITPPTRGTAILRGRVGAMLEVTAGFHEELTGRENIFLSGAILGMTQRSISSRIDQIVEYAGVEDAMDTPVKRYSSGMSARLGFSVAVHLNAEIMLIDEVLAVGDAAFRAKCLETMRSLAASGRSIIFVSHELDMLERLCDRAILIDRGVLLEDGDPRDLANRHRALSKNDSEACSSIPQADHSST